MKAHPRFLVLRGGAVGDFIVTLPALQAIRRRWPGAYIELIGYPGVARLALGGGLVDRVRSLDEAAIARLYAWDAVLAPDAIEHLRSFDIVFTYLYDPDGTVRENLERAGVCQVVYGSPLVRDQHAIEHLFVPLADLALYPEPNEYPLLAPDPEQARRARDWLRAEGIGTRGLAVHPGSGGTAKIWPPERFLAVARHARSRGARPFFLFGEADAPVRDALPDIGQSFPVLEQAGLELTAAVLGASRAYIGNDSGITHLAAAVGTPVLALFGPSDPALWAPRGPSVHVLRAQSGDICSLPLEKVIQAIPSSAWEVKRKNR